MRALLTLTISFLLLLISSWQPLTAHAVEYPYAYAEPNSTVYLCSAQSDSTALFAIPQTYCVTILSESNGWYYCRYAEDVGIYRSVTGYCRKDGLKLISEPLANMFLNLPITITYKSDVSDELLPPLDEIEVTAAYYGVYKMAAADYSYVLYNTSFGYVRTTVNTYPLNTIPEEDTPVINTDEKNYTALITIAIITLAGFAVAVLYFSSSKKYKH